MPRPRRMPQEQGDASGIVGAQWVGYHTRLDGLAGVRRLMLAILQDALREVQRRRDPGARAWIAANERRWLFSFVNICDALEISPDQVRRLVPVARLHGAGTHSRCARASQKMSHRAVG